MANKYCDSLSLCLNHLWHVGHKVKWTMRSAYPRDYYGTIIECKDGYALIKEKDLGATVGVCYKRLSIWIDK